MTKEITERKKIISMGGMWVTYFTKTFMKVKVRVAKSMYRTPGDNFISVNEAQFENYFGISGFIFDLNHFATIQTIINRIHYFIR